MCQAKVLAMQKGFSVSGARGAAGGLISGSVGATNMSPPVTGLSIMQFSQTALTVLGRNPCKVVRTRLEAYAT